MTITSTAILALLLWADLASGYLESFKAKSSPHGYAKNNVLRKFDTDNSALSLISRGHSALHVSPAAVAEEFADGEASLASSTFNLGKSIIGAGVLSIPCAIGFISDYKTALVPTFFMSLVIGAISAYCFSRIAKACSIHKVKSYQEAWIKSVDPKTGWIVSFASTSMCFLLSLAYVIIIGDTFSALSSTFHLPAFFQGRNNVIISIVSCILLPLCSMKSLNALAPFSVLGLVGTLYTGVFMSIRFLDGSYLPGGQFYSSLTAATEPIFNTRSMALTPAMFVLISMLSTSYIAHYNAPRFLIELKNPTMKRFNIVVAFAFLIACATYSFITASGFLTFGGNSLGFLLNNYSNNDNLATFARLAIGAAIISGFPFTFTACKDGVLDLLNISFKKRDSLMPLMNIGLLSMITLLALVLKDVSFVVGFSGSLFGAAIMFIFPAIMTICNLKKDVKNEEAMTSNQKVELYGNYVISILGVILTIVGVAVSLLKELGRM
mmetsp:Transcript_3989/g.4071  ORF Transcript_3989/g.4071 Transcript_3989/m.4071 type:complete len:494 (-) Transcript_3989:129-1610(-)